MNEVLIYSVRTSKGSREQTKNDQEEGMGSTCILVNPASHRGRFGGGAGEILQRNGSKHSSINHMENDFPRLKENLKELCDDKRSASTISTSNTRLPPLFRHCSYRRQRQSQNISQYLL
jgi:hypothetical protein